MSNPNDKALAVIPRTLPEIQSMAEVLAKSNLLPDALRGKVPDVVVQIMAGAELGLPPMASIRGIHIIAGRPILAADTMMALVLGSGLAEYFVQTESTATSVTFETKRKGAPVAQKCTWTIEDAKRAALNMKDVWRTYPRQMLASRCKAELARAAFPDLLAGCYDPDETHDSSSVSAPTIAPVIKSDPVDAIDAEIVTPLDAIAAAADVGALRALVPMLASLPKGADRDRAREAYGVKMRDFEAALAPATAAAVNAVTEQPA